MIEHNPKPRLRVTGGVLLGARTPRPMAFADEEEQVVFQDDGQTAYKARKPYHIIGFPYRMGLMWRIRPHVSRHTDLVAPAWEGFILSGSGGCQFFIKDTYIPNLISAGGLYRVNGTYVSTPGSATCEIVQRDFSYIDSESQNYVFDSATGVISQAAVSLTRISVVYETGGVYYLSNLPAPDDGPGHPVPSFPGDFYTDHPL